MPKSIRKLRINFETMIFFLVFLVESPCIVKNPDLECTDVNKRIGNTAFRTPRLLYKNRLPVSTPTLNVN